MPAPPSKCGRGRGMGWGAEEKVGEGVMRDMARACVPSRCGECSACWDRVSKLTASPRAVRAQSVPSWHQLEPQRAARPLGQLAADGRAEPEAGGHALGPPRATARRSSGGRRGPRPARRRRRRSRDRRRRCGRRRRWRCPAGRTARSRTRSARSLGIALAPGWRGGNVSSSLAAGTRNSCAYSGERSSRSAASPGRADAAFEDLERRGSGYARSAEDQVFLSAGRPRR
jgi:hypothetical protein